MCLVQEHREIIFILMLISCKLLLLLVLILQLLVLLIVLFGMLEQRTSQVNFVTLGVEELVDDAVDHIALHQRNGGTQTGV